MKAVDNAVDTLDKKTDKRIVSGETARENGAMVARVMYDDGTERVVRSRRGEDGKLFIEPESDVGDSGE